MRSSLDTLRLALQVPLRNLGRSLLTVLGLAIGVGAFVAMVSFGQGARASVVAQFETLGTNMLHLRPAVGTQVTFHPIYKADVAALRREGTSLEIVAPSIKRDVRLVYEGREHLTALHGTTPQFLELREWGTVEGGMFDSADLAQQAKVCVLGATPARELFPNETPLGKRLHIDRSLTCRVIGVLETRGQAISGSDLDDIVLLPLTAHEAYLGAPDGYTFVEIRPQRPDLHQTAKTEIGEIMRRAHGLEPEDPADYDLVSPDEVTRVAERVTDILTVLLAAIASVSLLVGGIGIMNIQLVSVAERTHEIGIRAAVGAAPRQILAQFVAEAVILALIGSAAGVALGITASWIVADRMGWPGGASPEVVIGSALFGIAVGTLFGFIPAKHAARLDPIQALRRE
jgi:putative ABC transport system permease protein